MKKLLICLLFPLAAFSQPVGFNTFVTGLSSGTIPTGIEILPVVQGGSTVKMSVSQIKSLPANVQSGTTYTLVIGDNSKNIEMTSSSSNVVTIPPNSSVAFPVGTIIYLTQYGTGVTSVAAGIGVTIRSSSGVLTSPGQYVVMQIIQRVADEWYLENGATITGSALTKTNDTNVTLTLGGSPSVALLSPASLTVGWTGTLAYSRFVNGTGLSLVGRSSNSSGVQADIVAGSDFQIMRRSGTSIAFGSIDLSQSGAVGASILGAVNGGTGISSLGTGISTWLGTPSWTNFSSAITGTSPYWALTGTSNLTGATTIGGTSTNILKYTFSSLGTTQTDGAGIWLQNPTQANLGAQQISPSITWEGQGNGSTTIQASQSVKFIADVLPVQAASNPSATWRLRASINGAAYSDQVTFNTSSGLLSTTAGVNGSGSVLTFAVAGSEKARFTSGDFLIGSTTDNAKLYVLGTAQTTAYIPTLRIDPGANTGTTASTPKPNILISASTQQWSTGALSGQANFEIGSETISFVGASTATEPTGLLVHGPTQGTNANTFVRPSALTLDGDLFFKTGGTVFGIIGTTTNDNPITGNVGESVSSLIATGSAVSLTTATSANVTSISLTAGDWTVEGLVNFKETASTVTARSASTGSTSATLATDGTEGNNGVQSVATTEVNSIALPLKRFSLSSTTTIYLVAQATFSAGTCAAYGYISARRVR